VAVFHLECLELQTRGAIMWFEPPGNQVTTMQETIQTRFEESMSAVRDASQRLADRIAEAAQIIIDSYTAGGGLYVFGNGGSAADAQHIACELVGRFLKERRALRAQALTTDSSILTAVSNDYEIDRIFSRQLEAAGRPGDVAIGISTSGDSANVLAALRTAREMGMKTIALTGPGGGQSAQLADVLIDAGRGDSQTPRIQEAHAVIYHILCELVEEAFVEKA